MAVHAAGYTQMKNGVSTPRTISSDQEDGLRVPKAALIELRTKLSAIYPELAKKPFSGTRMCWYVYISGYVKFVIGIMLPRYTDSPDGDWVIGVHPEDRSLVLATAGSGHAYKVNPA